MMMMMTILSYNYITLFVVETLIITRNTFCPIATSTINELFILRLKSDVTIVFLDPDFL